MLFTILIYIAVIGAPALAVYSVFRRTKKADPDVAGYIYNGKNWVAWLLVLSLLAWIFMGFIMPLLDGASYYDPEWGALGFMLIAILLYISYAVIAYVPATAQELEENKDSEKKSDRQRSGISNICIHHHSGCNRRCFNGTSGYVGRSPESDTGHKRDRRNIVQDCRHRY